MQKINNLTDALIVVVAAIIFVLCNGYYLNLTQPLAIAHSFIAVSFLYLLGSIPFGFIIARVKLKTDIRQIGSGNIGATNVFRTGDKLSAALTLLLDLLKGYAPLALIGYLNQKIIYVDYQYSFHYLIPVMGHMFPFWLGLKGGKGIATGLGILIYYSYTLTMIGVIIWGLVFWRTKISSAAALVSFITIPFIDILMQPSKQPNIWLWVLTIFIFCKHKDNIARIIKKQEKKIGRNSIQKK